MRPSLRKGAHAALSSAAWQEIRVRSGRDDKVEGSASIESSDWDGGNADPSTTLRSGRDDKGRGDASMESLGTLGLVSKKVCHLDRSAAECRGLRLFLL